MIACLIVYAAAFIDSNQVTISAFYFCTKGPNETRSCHDRAWSTLVGAGEPTVITRVAVILCLYTPLVLVGFALLSSLLAAYGRDLRVLRVSAGCQAASCVLTLLGLVGFLGLYWNHASPATVTPCYYGCVVAHMELAVTTYLSSMWSMEPITM
ncbi:unnamed protein product [Merluccius merluccius]